MGKYILKRIALAVLTLFLVCTLTFFLMNLVPGGPFMAEKAISAQAQAAMNEKYGLDKPLTEQYVNYMATWVFRSNSVDAPLTRLSLPNSPYLQKWAAFRCW